MAPQKQKRKATERGIGAVRATRRPPATSGVDVASPREPTDEDDRPASLRDTLPAPPSWPVPATGSGSRRATNLGLSPFAPPALPAPASLLPAPRSAPPVSGVGRYSARALHDDVVLPPSRARPIVARRDVPVATKPRVVRRTRPAPADLDTSEAFIHAFLDAPLTVEEIVDITGMPEREVVRIITRLIHVGIASYSG